MIDEEDTDLKVVWIDKAGVLHDDEDYYYSGSAANMRAMEIMAEHRADIHRIWLQSRRVQF